MSLFNREPAVIIGIVATGILAAVQQAVGQGVIGADAGTTIIAAISPEGGWLIPIIVALVTRAFVFSPAKAAELKAEVPAGYVKA